MPEITFRRGAPSDAAVLAEINIESWRVAFRGLFSDDTLSRMSMTEQTARFDRILSEQPEVEVWVAVQGTGAVGYGTIGPERAVESAAGMCELRALYLRPVIWRRGVGRRLHDQLLDRMAKTQFDNAMLWVFEINARARAFYEALGWAPTGETDEIRLGDELQVIRRYERSLT